MKILSSLLALTIIYFNANAKDATFQGSTPPHGDVRDFLGISLTDSIDFIRWKIVIGSNRYDLDCRYGISKPNTPGFIDEKKATFSGPLSKQGYYYQLQRGSKTFYILEINSNLLHLLDRKKAMLIGNGGYSYALNITTPIKSNQFNPQLKQLPPENYMVFEGRTPCQELAKIMGQTKSPDCNKIKWYIILCVDPVTRQPSYYLQGGRQYKKESMIRGNWEITRGKDGRVIYELDPEKKANAVHLLKADDNILFFTDADGNLLVGDENFSYTLNRTTYREPGITK